VSLCAPVHGSFYIVRDRSGPVAQKYVGAFGIGSRIKFIANHLVRIHNLVAAEAIVLGEIAGLDPALVFDAIADSAGSSPMFQIRSPIVARGQYDEPTVTFAVPVEWA
jgi:3-hydroxyisobutyrate dehydrogenase